MLELLNETERRTLDAYVAEPPGDAREQELVDATFPLFLESGRQMSPQFRTPAQHAASPSRTGIDGDAVEVWPCR